MSVSSHILLPFISYGFGSEGPRTIVGEPAHGSAFYFGLTSGYQTILLSLFEFSGYIVLEGSIAADPGASDWATVAEFGDLSSELTENSAVNIAGNFVWLRARVEFFSHGNINEMKVAYQ